MPTIVCPICKKDFSVGGVPEKNLSYLIPDTSVEKLVGRIMEISRDKNFDEEQKETGIDFEIITRGNEVYICPNCETIIISGNGELAGVYRKEKK